MDERASGSAGEKGSVWESVAAGVSAVVVLGALGITLHEALTTPNDAPPRIEITADTIMVGEGGFLVEFTARNQGHGTAAGLVVEGELRSDTGTVEKAEVTIDFVPAQASRRGGLFFSRDPRRFTLEIRPKGYDHP